MAPATVLGRCGDLARGGLDTRRALSDTSPHDVDWIVYSFGTNDAAPWKQVPPDEFERNYARLLASAAIT